MVLLEFPAMFDFFYFVSVSYKHMQYLYRISFSSDISQLRTNPFLMCPAFVTDKLSIQNAYICLSCSKILSRLPNATCQIKTIEKISESTGSFGHKEINSEES